MGHGGAERVDRHGHLGGNTAYGLHAASDAVKLLLLADLGSAGTRGIAAHIEHVSAIGHHLLHAATYVVEGLCA